jgi:hypothetical protein
MAAFPTLSSGFQSFPEQPIDDTIKSDSDAGYTITRPRFTRIRRIFGPVDMVLNRVDRDALVAFDSTVKGSTIFTIAHPVTGELIKVRFKSDGRVKTEPVLGSNPANRQFKASFTLEEV